MKKNVICILLVLVLSLSVISCGDKAAESSIPSEDVVILPTELPTELPAEPAQEPAETPEDVDSGMTIGMEEEFKGVFTALLSEIRQGYFPGTAGSSLSGAAFAAKLADMFSLYAPDEELVKSVVESYCAESQMDDVTKEIFGMQLTGLKDSFAGLVNNGIEVLDSAGYAAEQYPWDNDRVAALIAVMGEGFAQG